MNEGITTWSKESVNYNDRKYVSYIQKWDQKCETIPKLWIMYYGKITCSIWRNEVWELVPEPNSANIIGTEWIYKNNSDVKGNVRRNKACLVAEGYTQIEGVNFDETFPRVSHMEAIRLLLWVSCLLKFKLYQMDVESSF